jgi:hypothetical protein
MSQWKLILIKIQARERLLGAQALLLSLHLLFQAHYGQLGGHSWKGADVKNLNKKLNLYDLLQVVENTMGNDTTVGPEGLISP